MTPFIKKSRKRPNYSNRKQISGCLELGIGDIWGYKKTFYDDEIVTLSLQLSQFIKLHTLNVYFIYIIF